MTEYPDPGPRIAVIGVTGSGKTFTARSLAQHLGIPHIELDALHWLPGWTMTEIKTFRRVVDQALSGPYWIADGNYGKVRDIIWPRATGMVWLDYPLPTILWQLIRRTMKRVITREMLWNNNRESFQAVFLSKDSLLLWALQTYQPYRRTYKELLLRPEFAHLKVVRLHSRKETAHWLASLLKNPSENQQ